MEPIDIVHLKLANFLLEELKKIAIKDVKFEEADNTADELDYCFLPKMYPMKPELEEMNSDKSIKIAKNLYIEVNISFYQYRITKDGKRTQLQYGIKKLPFKSLSFQIYHKKVLLCKADWACVYSGGNNEMDHPQPHWHFDPEEILKASIGNNNDANPKTVPAFDDVLRKTKQDAKIPAFKPTAINTEIAEEKPKLPYPLVKIHFANSSKWPDNNNDNPEITEAALKYWFVNCINSVRTEYMQYV